MNFERMIGMTAIEYRLYKFYERIKELTEYNNKERIQELIEYNNIGNSNDVLDMIKDEVEKMLESFNI